MLGGTRVLEGAATAASIPSILGFLAMATMRNEELRGKVSARFELATLAGIGGGTLAATVSVSSPWAIAFFLNAGIYVLSLADLPIRRQGTRRTERSARAAPRNTAGRRYFSLLRTSHIWLLAPTWIAVNAAIGVYSGTGLFNLVRDESEKFLEPAPRRRSEPARDHRRADRSSAPSSSPG